MHSKCASKHPVSSEQLGTACVVLRGSGTIDESTPHSGNWPVEKQNSVIVDIFFENLSSSIGLSFQPKWSDFILCCVNFLINLGLVIDSAFDTK